MAIAQSEVAGVVISFAGHAARSPSSTETSCLTPRDRIDITAWQDRARAAGFDRMVIHDRDAGDASDVGNFLSVYCNGQPWSRWGFTRVGQRLRAWCCLTGSDVGEYVSLADALQSVLVGLPVAPVTVARTNLVRLPDRRRMRLGSAA